MGKYEKFLTIIITAISVLGVFSFFDKVLAVSAILCVFLAAVTLLFLSKTKIGTKEIYTLFFIVFLLHIAAALFIYYAHFQPFADGSGDFVEYNYNAQKVAERLNAGNFSLAGLQGLYYPITSSSQYFAVLIGYIYAFTIPNMLIGQLFNAWLAALIALLSYLIVIEISGSKNGAFLVGIIVALYPSLLFFGSLLLKDALIAFLSLCGVLLIIKLIKNFRYSIFALFYLLSGAVLHFRFYIGYAVIFTFLICWSLFSNLNFKKRIIYILLAVFLFGFLPQIFVLGDAGYWGNNLFRQYLNQKTISYYRQTAYAPDTSKTDTSKTDTSKTDTSGSTFDIDTNFSNPVAFIKGYAISFIYAVLSPFPWQIKYKRQLFSLIEIIPWYILLFFITKGIIKNIKRYYKVFSPLMLFSLIILGNIALFINNFGIITRIRIPAFICLLCFLPFGSIDKNIIYDYFKKIYINLKKWRQK